MAHRSFWTGKVIFEYETFEVKIPVSVVDHVAVINHMVDQHSGTRAWFNGNIVEGIFQSEDDACNFQEELNAYVAQQEWLDMNTDDYGINLGPISPNGVPDLGDLHIGTFHPSEAQLEYERRLTYIRNQVKKL